MKYLTLIVLLSGFLCISTVASANGNSVFDDRFLKVVVKFTKLTGISNTNAERVKQKNVKTKDCFVFLYDNNIVPICPDGEGFDWFDSEQLRIMNDGSLAQVEQDLTFALAGFSNFTCAAAYIEIVEKKNKLKFKMIGGAELDNGAFHHGHCTGKGKEIKIEDIPEGVLDAADDFMQNYLFDDFSSGFIVFVDFAPQLPNIFFDPEGGAVVSRVSGGTVSNIVGQIE